MLRAACWIGSRQVFERPVRTILTIAGIALGVSVAIAIPTANEEVLKSFQDTVTAVAGRATLQVSGGELGLDEGVLPEILAHPAVASASPVLSQGGRLVTGAHRGQALLVMGLDLLDAPDLKGITVRTDSEEAAGRFDALLASDAIFIGRRLADERGLHVGSPLDLLVGTQVHHLVVRGVVESSGGVDSAWSQMAVMDIASAQVRFGLVGRLDRIDLVTDPGKPVAEVAGEVQAMLPPALTVSRPARRNEQAEHMVRAFQLNLATLSAVGLLVGLLIVYNTVSFTVVRKRREIGIMRAIGMSRRGVAGLFLVQAAVMGLAGGVLGSGLGVALARGLAAILARTVSNLYAPVSMAGNAALAVSPGRIGQGMVVGMLVSMAGALLPSLEAGRTVPSRALAPGSYEVEQHLRAGRLAWVGIGGLFLAGLLALPGPIDGLPLFGYASAFCLLLSLSFFAPGIVGLIGWLLMRRERGGGGFRSRNGWTGRIGAIGRLAIGQVAQAPGRSAVTISALVVAIALMVGVGIMVRSFRSTVELWINQTVMADLIVAPVSWPDGNEAGMPARRLPLAWAEALAAVPGVAAVGPYRQVRMEIQGRPASLVARDLRLHGERSRYLFLAGDPAETLNRTLSEEGVILSEVLARTLGVEAGDLLRIMTPAGERPFPILGIFYDYATDGGKVVMDGALYRRFWPDETATVFALYLARPGDATLGWACGARGRHCRDPERRAEGGYSRDLRSDVPGHLCAGTRGRDHRVAGDCQYAADVGVGTAEGTGDAAGDRRGPAANRGADSRGILLSGGAGRAARADRGRAPLGVADQRDQYTVVRMDDSMDSSDRSPGGSGRTGLGCGVVGRLCAGPLGRPAAAGRGVAVRVAGQAWPGDPHRARNMGSGVADGVRCAEAGGWSPSGVR
jgi:putative ABC transport system permease protein